MQANPGQLLFPGRIHQKLHTVDGLWQAGYGNHWVNYSVKECTELVPSASQAGTDHHWLSATWRLEAVS